MVVENGECLENADSYVEVNFADDYFSSRNPQWQEKTQEEKETALILATDFIDNTFKWYGKRKTQEQSLAFPREELFDRDGYKVEGIPLKLKQAVCDCAIKCENGHSLFQENEGAGAVVSETIGSISFHYDVSKKIKNASLLDSVNSKLRGFYVDTSSPSITFSRVTK